MFTSEFDDSLYITPLHDISASPLNNLGIPDWLLQVNKDIDKALSKGVGIRQLVTARATAMDELLVALFQYFQLDKTACFSIFNWIKLTLPYLQQGVMGVESYPYILM